MGLRRLDYMSSTEGKGKGNGERGTGKGVFSSYDKENGTGTKPVAYGALKGTDIMTIRWRKTLHTIH